MPKYAQKCESDLMTQTVMLYLPPVGMSVVTTTHLCGNTLTICNRILKNQDSRILQHQDSGSTLAGCSDARVIVHAYYNISK